jgi:chromosomal replication initiator protein
LGQLEGVFALQFDRGGGARRGTPPGHVGPAAFAEYIGDGETILVRIAIERGLSEPAYQPLVFVGPAMRGKTMLARGVWERLHAALSPKEVLFYSGAAFSRACGLAAETNTIPEFRRRLQNAAALVVDDLHQVARKPLAQEELIGTIDHLLAQGRPVVATMRQLPAETEGLQPLLASRLFGGLVVPLKIPGPAARREILRRLAVMYSVQLDDVALDYLAGAEAPQAEVRSHASRWSVPQLARTFQRLRDAAGDGSLDVSVIHHVLGEELAAGQPDLRTISSAVARYFDQTAEDLRGPARRKELVQARGVAMYLARQLTQKSLGQVGKHFGNRDHTTVLHACRRTEQLMQHDATVRKAIEELTSQFVAD